MHQMNRRYDLVRSELRSYGDLFPNESPRHCALNRWLSGYERAGQNAEAVFARSNMTGHITASLLLFDAAHQNVLVIHHKLYDKWLQMGGHIDPDDLDAFLAAVREACEEAGVPDASYIRRLAFAGGPLDIDSHTIRANPRKNEAEHYHHDFMYVAELVKGFVLSPLATEVHGARWMPRSELRQLGDPRMSRIADKIDAFFPASTAAQAAFEVAR